MKTRLFFFFVLVLSAQLLSAQDRLETGRPAPPFSLKAHSPEGQTIGTRTNSDYSGKWLVLDFWTRACIACIHSMPKLSALQQRFQGRIDFLLIGKNDKRYNSGIEQFYRKLAISEKLKLYTAFDTASFSAYQVRATPQVVIIDPMGKVLVITSSDELSEEKLAALLEGKEPDFLPHIFFRKKVAPKPLADIQSSYVGSRSGHTYSGISYQSKLSQWKKGEQINLKLTLEKAVTGDTLELSAVSLERLYLLAYLGKAEWKQGDSLYLKVAKQLAIPQADSAVFGRSREKIRFSYSLALSNDKKGKLQWMEAIQADLKYRFGYLMAMENTLIDVYELQATAGTTVVKSESKRSVSGDATGYLFKGITMAELLARINYYHPKVLFSDRTGINSPVDISLQANMLELSSIQLGLRDNGLSLLPRKWQLQQLSLKKP